MSSKLIRVTPPGQELVDAGAGVTEGQASNKQAWYQRLVGRLLEVAGDTVTAGVGDRGEALRRNLKDLGQSVRGQPADDDAERQPSPSIVTGRSGRPYQTTWLCFSERVDVAYRLTQLVPEVMVPGGWSHVVTSPLERAQELLNYMMRTFPKGSGWEQTVSSCQGYMTNIERVAGQLGSMDRPSDGISDGSSTERDTSLAKVRERLAEARIAMGDLRSAFRKLVEAADYFSDLDGRAEP